MDKQFDPQRPIRLKKICEDIANKYENMQKLLSEKSQEFGYSKDVMLKSGDSFTGITDNPSLSSVEDIFKNQLTLVEEQEKYLDLFTEETRPSYIAYSSTTTAGLTVSAINPGFIPPAFVPPWKTNSEFKRKISKLDKELGKTYRSVWEVFYGTTKSPEKSALSNMRQTYDHFFRILSPDVEVRKSDYFQKKEDEQNPNMVYRSERIMYAAYTKVKDKTMADLLASQVKHILKIYNGLNKMHSEKLLERDNVERALNSMQCILEEWIDALEI
jgi:hypothetical protein